MAPLAPLKEARADDGVATGGKLEDGAQRRNGPTVERRAVEVTRGVDHQGGVRAGTVGAPFKAARMENVPVLMSYLKTSPIPLWSAALRCAKRRAR